MDESQIDQLQELSTRTGDSFAEHMRRACDLYLAINAQSGSVADAVTQAMQTFDDARTPERAIERIAVRWLHDREANSLRGGQSQVREQLGRVESLLTVVDERQSVLVEMMRQLVAGGVQADALYCAVESAVEGGES